MKLNSNTAISEAGFCVHVYVLVCMFANKKMGAY